MDNLIHVLVLKQEKKGRIPKYSTDITKSVEIIHHLPLHVGYLSQTMDNFTPTRPYFAADAVNLIVTAATPALALCKAALIYLNDQLPETKPSAQPPEVIPEPASNEAASD